MNSEKINKFVKETRFSLQLDKEQFYGLENKLMQKRFAETGVFHISHGFARLNDKIYETKYKALIDFRYKFILQDLFLAFFH